MSGKVRKRKIKPCLPTTAGQWLCAHPPKKKNQHEINKQTCFKKINDFDASNPPYPNTGRSPEPQVDRSLYHPKKKYFHKGVLISKKDFQAEKRRAIIFSLFSVPTISSCIYRGLDIFKF